MMSSTRMTTVLMLNLRKLCEYASDSYSVDYLLEQSDGTFSVSPRATL